MEVWVIGNQKGGVGKTTMSVNLHGVLTQAGVKTVLLDQDPQQASMLWAKRRQKEYGVDDVGVISWTPALSKSVLDRIEAELQPEVLIVDLPAGVLGAGSSNPELDRQRAFSDMFSKSSAPTIRDEALKALDLADLVIVPMSNTKLDIDSSMQFLAALSRRAKSAIINGGKSRPYLVVMNRVATDNVERRHTGNIVRRVRQMGHPVASQVIPSYKNYSGPMWKGMSSADYKTTARAHIVNLILTDIAPLTTLDLAARDFRYIRPAKLSMEG